MQNSFDHLSGIILKKNSFQDCTVEELRAYTQKYPWFNVGHLLLLKKMKEENDPHFMEQFEKTILHFDDPLLVDRFLSGNGSAIMVAKNPLPAEEPVVEMNEEALNEIAIMEETKEEPLQAVSDEGTGQVEETNSPIPSFVPMIEIVKTENEKDNVEEPVEDVKPGTESLKPHNEPASQVDAEIPSLKKDDTPPVSDFIFEPYHTVDYFASQGIKIRDEVKTNDKFGQQLKSFTEWLKTMKRLPVSQIAASGDVVAEKKVEQLAEHSLEAGDVVTEAMALVWEKQGNIEKAVDVYHKLSLLDPSKSAYFAAKIDSLKRS